MNKDFVQLQDLNCRPSKIQSPQFSTRRREFFLCNYRQKCGLEVSIIEVPEFRYFIGKHLNAVLHQIKFIKLIKRIAKAQTRIGLYMYGHVSNLFWSFVLIQPLVPTIMRVLAKVSYCLDYTRLLYQIIMQCPCYVHIYILQTLSDSSM